MHHSINLCIVCGADAQRDFDCVRNSPEILSRCGAELQYSGAVIQFNQTEIATEEDIEEIRQVFEENKLPTKPCCEIAKDFAEAKCICNPMVRSLLPAVGFQATAINSIMSIVQESCGGFEYGTCL